MSCLRFERNDHVFLKIAPNRSVIIFGKRGNLSPRYIGPFVVDECNGEVAYFLSLPPSVVDVHDISNVSQFRKYVPDSSHVINHLQITIRPGMTYERITVVTIDRRQKIPRHNKVVNLVRVMRRTDSPEGPTWEREEDMRARYPFLLPVEQQLDESVA